MTESHSAANVDGASLHSASDLLPLVYDELRRLAFSKLANESPGQTLQPTALVHEAWLRLSRAPDRNWQDRSGATAARERADSVAAPAPYGSATFMVRLWYGLLLKITRQNAGPYGFTAQKGGRRGAACKMALVLGPCSPRSVFEAQKIGSNRQQSGVNGSNRHQK